MKKTIEQIRQENIKKILARPKDDGKKGKAFELENARKGSKKVYVAKAGEADGSAKFRINGKIKYVKTEFKTNGGRVEDIAKAEFCVYRLDICNSSTSNKRRYVESVIIPSKVFLDFLYTNNLVKAINKHGKLDGYGIQASSKKLYLALLEWCIPYDKDTIYTYEDFEGLTL